MTDVSGNAKFDEDLHQALEENLSLFPVVQLKAELNFVIVKLWVNEMFSDSYLQDMETA